MTQPDTRKHPLLSRKFWLATITAVTMFLSYYYGLELDPEIIAAVILPVVTWIIGESMIDCKHKN